GIHGDVLFHDYGTTGRFVDATRVAGADHFTLWRPRRSARLVLVVEGRFWDGWLSPDDRLQAWPTRPGDGVRVSFRLGLPTGSKLASGVPIGKSSCVVRP